MRELQYESMLMKDHKLENENINGINPTLTTANYLKFPDCRVESVRDTSKLRCCSGDILFRKKKLPCKVYTMEV